MTARGGAQISVCLLTYQHAALVESTLDSVLAQDIDGFELIVSDDGMPGNANFAARHSSRPYLALLHHDDLYRPDLLSRWLGVMQRHPDVTYVFNSYAHYGDTRPLEPPLREERLDGKRFLEEHLLPRWGCPVRGTAMIRRSALEAGTSPSRQDTS